MGEIQVILIIALIIVAIRLVLVFFRIAKSLEGIDETLYQIHKVLDKNNKNSKD